MRMYVCLYAHVCACMRMCVFVCACVCLYAHVRVCMRMCVFVCACVCLYAPVCACMSMCVCFYAHVCVCLNMAVLHIRVCVNILHCKYNYIIFGVCSGNYIVFTFGIKTALERVSSSSLVLLLIIIMIRITIIIYPLRVATPIRRCLFV